MGEEEEEEKIGKVDGRGRGRGECRGKETRRTVENGGVPQGRS